MYAWISASTSFQYWVQVGHVRSQQKLPHVSVGCSCMHCGVVLEEQVYRHAGWVNHYACNLENWSKFGMMVVLPLPSHIPGDHILLQTNPSICKLRVSYNGHLHPNDIHIHRYHCKPHSCVQTRPRRPLWPLPTKHCPDTASTRHITSLWGNLVVQWE